MQHRISRSPLLPSVFVLLAVPTGAQAHGAIKGLEGFTSGLVHPLTTPAHVLVIVALGLLLGQQKPLDLKRPLLVLMPLLKSISFFYPASLYALQRWSRCKKQFRRWLGTRCSRSLPLPSVWIPLQNLALPR